MVEPRGQNKKMVFVELMEIEVSMRTYRGVADTQSRVTVDSEYQEEMTTKGCRRDDDVVLDIGYVLLPFVEDSEEDIPGLGVFDIRRCLFPSAVGVIIGEGCRLQLFEGFGGNMTIEVVQDFWTKVGRG